MNPYKILGINEQATDEEIKRAYLAMAAKYHPDVGGDAWVFEQVRESGMPDARVVKWIIEKYSAIEADLDERARRRWAAAESRSLGWGGIVAVAEATGIAERTIRRGIAELDDPIELQRQGFQVSSVKVGQLLKAAGYSLQANRKTIEGNQHPDRNAQFEFIAKRIAAVQKNNQPAISVDTKKKEVLGNL
jgi:hypothetical protein